MSDSRGIDTVWGKFFICVECGRMVLDYEAYERRGKIYCGRHLLDTAAKRAYERWFVKE